MTRHELAHPIDTPLTYDEELIVCDPDMRGGQPTLKGHRITVYEIAGPALAHGKLEVLVNLYPWLNEQQVDAAIRYAKAHPRPHRTEMLLPSNARLVSTRKVSLVKSK